VNHLGPRVTALVDGELDPATAERALAHAASCAECREALSAERAAKAAFRSLSDPGVPDDLTARLLAMAAPGEPVGDRPRPMPGSKRPPTLPPPGRPDGRRYAARRPLVPYVNRRPGSSRSVLRRGGTVAGGVLSAVGCAVGAAFMLGGAAEPTGPALLPPVATFAEQHAATAGTMPLGDPAFGAVQATMSVGYGPTLNSHVVRRVPFR
jgi:anti-sigma factor RsiW